MLNAYFLFLCLLPLLVIGQIAYWSTATCNVPIFQDSGQNGGQQVRSASLISVLLAMLNACATFEILIRQVYNILIAGRATTQCHVSWLRTLAGKCVCALMKDKAVKFFQPLKLGVES